MMPWLYLELCHDNILIYMHTHNSILTEVWIPTYLEVHSIILLIATWHNAVTHTRYQFEWNDVTMGVSITMTSQWAWWQFQITSLTIVYSTFYSGADQRKHQSSPSLAFVRGIHGWPVNSPHKGPVMRKMFPFDDVIMQFGQYKFRKVEVIILLHGVLSIISIQCCLTALAVFI